MWQYVWAWRVPLVWVLDRREHRDAAARRRAWRTVVTPGIIIGGLLFAGSALQQRLANGAPTVVVEETVAEDAA